MSASASSIGRPSRVSVSTRLNSSLAGRLPSSTTAWSPCLNEWPAFSDAAIVDQQVGQLVLERLDPAPRPGARRTRTGAAPPTTERDEREQRGRAGDSRRALPRRRRTRSSARRTRPAGAAGRRARASARPSATGACRPNVPLRRAEERLQHRERGSAWLAALHRLDRRAARGAAAPSCAAGSGSARRARRGRAPPTSRPTASVPSGCRRPREAHVDGGTSADLAETPPARRASARPCLRRRP